MHDDATVVPIRIDQFHLRPDSTTGEHELVEGSDAHFDAQVVNPNAVPLDGVEIQLVVDGSQVGGQLVDRLDPDAAEWIQLSVAGLTSGGDVPADHQADLTAVATSPATEATTRTTYVRVVPAVDPGA